MPDEYNEDDIKNALDVIEEEKAVPDDGDVLSDDSSAKDAPSGKGDEPDADAESQEVDSELEDRAKRYGLNPEHFVNQEALQDAVTAFDQQAYEAGQQYLQQQQAGNYYQPQGQQQQEEYQPPEFKFEFQEEWGIDPEVQESLNKGLSEVTSHFQQQQQILAQHVIAQQQWIQQQQESVAQQEQQRVLKEFDEAIEGLGRPGTFGKDSFGNLQPNSNEHVKRAQILNHVQVQLAGFDALGQPRPPLAEMVRQADLAINAKEIERVKQLERARKAKGQSRGRTGGVSSKGDDVTPDDPALNPKVMDFWDANQV